MEPIEYLRAFRRRWAVIALVVVLASGVAWLTSTVAPPDPPVRTYEATTVLLRTGPGASVNLETWAALTTLHPVVSRVARVTGYSGNPGDLAALVRADADVDTGLLYIIATSTEPGEAKLLADTFAEGLIGYLDKRSGAATVARRAGDLLVQIGQLEREIGRLNAQIAVAPPGQVGALTGQRNTKTFLRDALSADYRGLVESGTNTPGLQVVQEASPGVLVPLEGFRVPQSRTSRLMLAALFGLLIGVGVALVAERFDTRIRTKEAAEEHFRLPVLAEIPVIPRRNRGRVIAAAQPTSPTAEAFRLLGTEVVQGMSLDGGTRGKDAGAGKPPHTVLVASGAHSEGRTTLVANLAVALADMGKRVLVISCDFRRPDLHRLFGIANHEGLADALRSDNSKPILDGYIWPTSFDDIWVVPSGSSPERPGELLSSEGMRQALAEARGAADVVLLDTAPLLAASDAAHLFPEVDAVLVVARAGTTRGRLAERTTGLLTRLGAPVVGVALNGATGLPGGHREPPERA